MSRVLAIDQSTSATKAMVFDEAGTILAKVSREHRQIYPRPGWVEHDAEEIYRNVVDCVRTLAGGAPGAVGGFACLSITNQRETFVVFDKATGAPLHHAIVWQCRRGDPVCTELVAAGHRERVRDLTGLTIDTYFPAPKLKWLLDDNADVRRAVESGSALVGTIDAYLVYRLTNGRVFATDHTNASRTLMYDIARLTWAEELCALFGCPLGALPEPRASSARFGDTDVEGVLPRRIPICGVMGDSQAALFAQLAFTPGSAKVTFGTGSSVLLNLGGTARRSKDGLVTTVAWVHDGRPAYAFEGIINCTGATIAWLKDRLELISTPQETERLATEVDDNGGVYLVPAFAGLSAPYWSQDARAAIVGLTQHSTRKHVVRAALESIAYQVRDVLESMAAASGTPLVEVNADGGMVANAFLMQFVADVARLTVRASTVAELSALGAALSGMLGTGVHSSLDELSRLPLGHKEYAPEMAPERAARAYDGWKCAVARTL